MFAFPYSRLGCVMSGGAGWCKLQLTRHKSPPADQRVVQLWWSSSCKAVAAPSWDRATSRGRHFLRRHSRPPPLVASSFSPHAFLFWQENRVEGQNLLLPGKTVDDKIGSRTGSPFVHCMVQPPAVYLGITSRSPERRYHGFGKTDSVRKLNPCFSPR